VTKMWKLWKNDDTNESKEEFEKSENIEEKLQKWLREEGFCVEKASGNNLKFRYVASKNGSPKFSVLQPRDKSDLVLIESGLSFNGIEKDLVSRIINQNGLLSLDLKMHLMSKGFFYRILPPDLQFSNAGALVFAKQIYYDGLSKGRFLDTVAQAISTIIFVILTIRKHMSTSATNSSERRNTMPYLA
jgi:hypothetical protein